MVSLSWIDDTAGEENGTRLVVTNEEEERVIDYQRVRNDGEAAKQYSGRGRGRCTFLVDLDIRLMEHVVDVEIACSVDTREIRSIGIERAGHAHRGEGSRE